MRLVLVIGIAALAATGLGSTGDAAPAACGPQQIGGATVRNWCGPAKATVTWTGKTITIKGGACDVTKVPGLSMFTVNVGRFTVPQAKPKFTSFSAGGSDLKAGTYRSWLVNFQTPGKQWTLRPSSTKVTITKGARTGTFTGTLYESGKVAKGSWTC